MPVPWLGLKLGKSYRVHDRKEEQGQKTKEEMGHGDGTPKPPSGINVNFVHMKIFVVAIWELVVILVNVRSLEWFHFFLKISTWSISLRLQ